MPYRSPELILEDVFYAMQKRNSNRYGYGHVHAVGSQGVGDSEQAVGYCHDVVEDGFADYEDLADWGLNDAEIDAVRLLCRVEGQTYDEYITSLVEAYRASESGSRLAVAVKCYDIFNHLHPHHVKDRSPSGAARYLKALQRLVEVQLVRKE